MKKPLHYLLVIFLLFFIFFLPYFITESKRIKEVYVTKDKIFISQKLPYIQAKHLQAYEWGYREKKALQLDFALTEDQRSWGMMGRSHLEENQGLFFIFPQKTQQSFWMFNCLIDLSLAILDDEGVIREIYELKAFPEQVKKSPKIQDVQDLKKLPKNHPSVHFFSRMSKKSTFPSRYALEMSLGWFKKHHYQVGDVIHADPQNKESYLYSTLDFSDIPFSNYPSMIKFPQPDFHPLCSGKDLTNVKLIFLDEKNTVLEMLVYQSHPQKVGAKEVIVPNFPYEKVLILPHKHPQLSKIFIGAPVLLGPV